MCVCGGRQKQNKDVPMKREEERERERKREIEGEKRKGRVRSWFEIQAATLGLSLPYIRTMNEPFSRAVIRI